MTYDVKAFGEALIRYESSMQYKRLESTDTLKMELGGAEINVLAPLAKIGNFKTAIITKLPNNPLGKWVQNKLDSYKVGTSLIASGGSRVGCYYTEKGSYPRTASVTYDRKHSSFAESSIEDYDYDPNCSAKIFHCTGITLALSDSVRRAATNMIKSFDGTDTLVSFDVNYRANLWSEDEARETIESILPYVDILFISEESCRRMFRRTGTIEDILRDFAKTYNISIIASTRRKVINQSHHQISSIVYEKKEDAFFETAKPYDIEVVDRVGSGDAYISGMLYGLLKNPFDCQSAQEYADAFSALKCTIPGDILVSSADEIDSLIKDHKAGIKSDIKR